MPRLHKRNVEAIGSVLSGLHDDADLELESQQVPESTIADFAGNVGFRQTPSLASAASAMRTVRRWIQWFRDADRWAGIIVAFRRLMNAVKVIQRFTRRACCKHQLLTEAVLASWRLKEERKLVAERERLLGNKRLTPGQKQFVLTETDQMSAPTPERVKRATVHLLWRERAKKYRQAWRAYTAEQHPQRCSPPGRRAQSILHALQAPPRFDFSPRDFPLAVLEREATLTQLVELDPKFGDVEAQVTDHRRRQPQRNWAPNRRFSVSPAHEKRNSVSVARREAGSRLGSPDPRKPGRERSLPSDRDGERESLVDADTRRSTSGDSHTEGPPSADPFSRWSTLALDHPGDNVGLDPEADHKGSPAQSPDHLTAEQRSPALPALSPAALSARPSLTGQRVSPKPKLTAGPSRPNMVRRMSSSPSVPAAPPHRNLSANTMKPSRPVSSLSRSSTPGLV
eukprot:EG_transcript_5396